MVTGPVFEISGTDLIFEIVNECAMWPSTKKGVFRSRGKCVLLMENAHTNLHTQMSACLRESV